MKIKKVFTALLTVLSLSSVAHADLNIVLDCEASVPNPNERFRPGSVDSRHLQLQLDTNGRIGGSGYKEDRAYGGSFATSVSSFGEVSTIQVIGRVAIFTLYRTGEIGYFGIPVPLTGPVEAMPATYDLDKNELTLDTSNINWSYRYPNVLKCTVK